MTPTKRIATAFALALLAVPAPALAASGSGGGGGGTGGGGGGGTPAPSVGSIRAVSAGAICTAGTTMGVSVDKGFNKRVDVTITAVGAPISPGVTSLGGYWTIQVHDDTHNAWILQQGTGLGDGTPSVRIQSLGATVPVGPSHLSFLARRTALGYLLPGVEPVPAPVVLESCSASLDVVGR